MKNIFEHHKKIGSMIVRGVPSYFVLVVFGITNGNIYVFLSKYNTQKTLRTPVYFYGDIVIYLKKHDSYAGISGDRSSFLKTVNGSIWD